MFYVVSAAVLLIIVGIFTLDIIKIIIGLVVVIIMFLIYRLKLHKATKDPVLFEMLKSITDLNREIDKEISNKRNYSLNDKKYMGIILLLHIGFVKAASDGAPIDEVKFKDLFYAAYNAMSFNLKKETINDLYNLYKNKSKHNIASGIILMGVQIYTFKLFNMSYIDKCLEAIDDLYNNPKIPNSIADYFNTSNDNKENRGNINNKNPILDSNSIFNSDHTKMKEAEQIYNLGVMYANGIAIEKDDKKAIELWEEAANIGYPLAHYNLGNWYFHGRAVQQSYEKAVEHYKKAADSGMLQAINNLANCYYQGLGVPVDNAEAVKLYLRAAEKGFAESQYHLGNCYYSGDGVEQSTAEMFKWHKIAAEQGHAEAQCNLGIYYADGIEVNKDLNEAYKWFKKAAEQGEERAINGLKMVENEIETNKNIINEEEYEILLESAKNGNAEAQYKIGACCFEEPEWMTDFEEALKWFMKAAKQNYPKALDAIGTFYVRGWGVKRDINEAIKWYEKAANQGFLESQYTLGLIYQNGHGVGRNNNEAFNWFKKAADQGSLKSQTMVGILYLDGLGVKKDIKEGIKWLRKAAEKGYDDAQYHLGIEYYFGENAPKDIMEARKWLLAAADQGHATARALLNNIEKEKSILFPNTP